MSELKFDPVAHLAAAGFGKTRKGIAYFDEEDLITMSSKEDRSFYNYLVAKGEELNLKITVEHLFSIQGKAVRWRPGWKGSNE